MYISIKQLVFILQGGQDKGVSNIGSTYDIRGWVRTARNQKTFSFIEVQMPHTYSNSIPEAQAPSVVMVHSGDMPCHVFPPVLTQRSKCKLHHTVLCCFQSTTRSMGQELNRE